MEIEEFMLAELKAMSENVCSNYERNKANREKNPFLPLHNDDIKKYMALGRSVDSQLGNRIQRIIFFLSRQRFGALGVPNITVLNYDDSSKKIIIKLFSVPLDLDKEYQNKDFNPFVQYVYFASSLSEKEAKKKLKIKANCNKLSSSTIEMDFESEIFTAEYLKWKGKNYPVDLLTLGIKDGIVANLFVYEIKLGGNLDTKNAPSNADEVLKNKNVFSFITNSHSYFATCYGECSQSVKNALEAKNCELLTPNDFWEKVLPSNISLDKFIEIFKIAFEKSKIEDAIKKL